VYYSNNFGPGTAVIANLNGHPDIVTGNLGGPVVESVSLLLQNRTGRFVHAVGYRLPGAGSAIAVADLNGDGRPDLAVATFGRDGVSVLLGIGHGKLRKAGSYRARRYPVAIATADLRSNGHLDLAVANADSNDVSILLRK
jgi:FG-GAP-like repeat